MSVGDCLLRSYFVIRRDLMLKYLNIKSVYVEDKIFKCTSTGSSEYSHIRRILER
jgi:hypothetical protein